MHFGREHQSDTDGLSVCIHLGVQYSPIYSWRIQARTDNIAFWGCGINIATLCEAGGMER